MAALWILLCSVVLLHVAVPSEATAIGMSSRAKRSYASDQCFANFKCEKVLPAHGELPGLKNPTDHPWYHCECTNSLNKCIREALGPYYEGYPASDPYWKLIGYVCYRERGNSLPYHPMFEKVTAPLPVDDIPIYW